MVWIVERLNGRYYMYSAIDGFHVRGAVFVRRFETREEAFDYIKKRDNTYGESKK